MPQIVYCPHDGCGAKNEYSINKPDTCKSCGRPFSKAFASLVPTQPTISQPVTRPAPRPTVTSAMTRPVPRIQSSGRPNQPAYDDSIDDYVDKTEMKQRAQELVESMSSSDFIIQSGGSRRVSLTDMLDKSKSVDIGVRGAVETELPPQTE